MFVVRTSNPSKTSEKWVILISLHILHTANQETEGSQDRLTGMFLVEQAFVGRNENRALLKMPAWEAISKAVVLREIKYCFQSSW